MGLLLNITCSDNLKLHILKVNQLVGFISHSTLWLGSPCRTLAYLLPVLSLATRRAEEEFVSLKRVRKAHEAGTLQVNSAHLSYHIEHRQHHLSDEGRTQWHVHALP